jgi:acetyl-CoA carboxylase biotin carboxylase subunit
VGSIRSVLVANRGEIALRIIRACRELGVESIQVYSEADRASLPVQMADRSVCIGGNRSSDSYLNKKAILSAALSQGADAIHPGYGFLAENCSFAKMCEDNNVIFIGPKSEVIELMGNKAKARKSAAEIGVPTTPGSIDPLSGLDEAYSVAEETGYPVMLKASAGGGGKGMQVVTKADEMQPLFDRARIEAKSAFGDEAIYIEKYLTNIRHIEIQVLADGQTAVHLGERDCTIQRRNQKLVEESPSSQLSGQMREEITELAVRLTEHVGYTSAGTIEFMLDLDTNHFYFMEMNTRIQVEHPVTEMVTGYDLVKKQIEIAAGAPLAINQEDISIAGHALECRLNAEDPGNNFMPSPGEVTAYIPSGGPGIRIDSHLFAGYRVPPYYDSLLGKVIAWGNTRDEVISRMERALNELTIEGVLTTIPFYRKLLRHQEFRSGQFNTRFIQDRVMVKSMK